MESKQIPGLVMAKLDFPLLVVRSCFRRLYGGPACIWRVASNGRFFFERLQRANGSRVDLLVDHCMRNLCKHWSTRPLITTTSSPPLSPTRSAACDMPWGLGEKVSYPRRLSARSPNHHLARCARSVVIWRPPLRAGEWNFNETETCHLWDYNTGKFGRCKTETTVIFKED